MTLCNSIIVDNRVLITAQTEDDPNIAGDSVVNGNSTLTTFSNWNSDDGNCSLFDPAVPLFLRDYDFTTKTIGDYRLAFSDISQAIDQGAVSYSADESDIEGKPRLSGASIDIGAYETQFCRNATATAEESYTAQAGCSIYFSVKENIENTVYLWDLDSDGIYEEHLGGFWASSGDLNGSQVVKMRTLGQDGSVSECAEAEVFILPTAPTIALLTTEYADGEILKLELNISSPGGKAVVEWRIRWGDDAEPQVFSVISNALKAAHFYANAGTYTVTLEMIDTAGYGAGTVYLLGRHTVPGQTVEAQPLVLESASFESAPSALSLMILTSSENLNDPLTEPPTEKTSGEFSAALLSWNNRSKNALSAPDVFFASKNTPNEEEFPISPEKPLPGGEIPTESKKPVVFDVLELDFINDETIGGYSGVFSGLAAPIFDGDEIGALI